MSLNCTASHLGPVVPFGVSELACDHGPEGEDWRKMQCTACGLTYLVSRRDAKDLWIGWAKFEMEYARKAGVPVREIA